MAINTADFDQIDRPNGSSGPPLDAGKDTAKKALRYMFLPGIIPQIQYISRSGFGYIAFLIAVIYQAVRILPENHPYVNPANIGRFGFREVIAAAANNVKVNRQNIDQIVVFIAILTGIFLLFLQFFALIWLAFNKAALAGSAVPDGIFITASPDTDIAFYMLREVFGIPDLFGAHAPTPFQLALHDLFHFYNFAILLVAVVVFLYFVVVVIGETASTGTPFGRRFSNVYAPIRLVVAIGLLVPLNFGFNASQYVTLYAAKLGSGAATNGWIIFNRGLFNPTGEENQDFIALPEIPSSRSLIEFMSIVRTCQAAYGLHDQIPIGGFIITGDVAQPIGLQAYQTFIILNPNTDVKIVFGAEGVGFEKYPGGVKPYCGELKIPSAVEEINSLALVGAASPREIQENYFQVVDFLFASPRLGATGSRFAHGASTLDFAEPCDFLADIPCNPSYVPPMTLQQEFIETIDTIFAADAEIVINNARNTIDLTLSQEIQDLGWGGAGIWYNKIAQVNGAYMVAIQNIPEKVKYPMVMEQVKDEKQKQDKSNVECTMFEPNAADNVTVKLKAGGTDDYYAKAMDNTFQWWRCDRGEEMTENFIFDSMALLFGLDGLFKLRENDGIHPLAKLSALGKSLVESAVRNMGFAIGGAAASGGVSAVVNPFVGEALLAAGSAFSSIATVGLSIGFILYYILPFLPFIYVFFALGSWVKSIFEAMVGAPLWALAHMRIDGDGLPGKMALNGYFMIFEIGLRPILTIFGLLGSIVIFTAMVDILNEVFELVTENITGTEIWEGADALELEFSRHIVDQFFYTILYAIVVYMMAISSFKMINLVPNNIMRWIGASISAFSDSVKDPTEGLAQYAAIGGNQIGAKLGSGLTQLGRGVGDVPGLASKIGGSGGSSRLPHPDMIPGRS